ncbi:MAG: hypothetical protein WBN59_07185 [Flavobacteriaceae bacterium]
MLRQVSNLFLVTLLWATFITMPVLGQNNATGPKGFGIIAQEGIYLHQSNTLLFAGERLYYKLYCLNLNEKKLSDLSKIGYVQLYNSQGETIFRHKIRLNNGIGTGDFSIPAELPTGSYKLKAYTNWMLSRAENQYFESNLLIINPYKATAETYLEKISKDSINPDSTTVTAVPRKAEILQFESKGDQIVSMTLNDTSFNTRSPVNITLEPLRYTATGGHYSLTVRKVDSSFPQMQEPSIEVWSKYGSFWTRNMSNPGTMPELRGELFSGRVVNRNDGQPAAGIKVILSLPGDPFVVEIVQSNADGRFYYNLDTPISSTQAVFQFLSKDREQYELQLDPSPVPDYQPEDFVEFTLSDDLEAAILERSIHNQIENAYAIAKSDTIENPAEDIPFYRNYQQRFFLDDYTRFNTLRETMVEIVDNAWIDENGEKDPTFGVRPLVGYLDAGGLLPMVFVDGLFIQDHKNLVNYNSKEIRSISLSRDRYLVGSQIFQGLLSLETKSGEFYKTLYREHLLRREVDRPEPVRRYYFADYINDSDASRIPDFRYQLFWVPDIALGNDYTVYRFSTSDVKGKFEVELKGYSSEGEPVSLRKQFTVE